MIWSQWTAVHKSNGRDARSLDGASTTSPWPRNDLVKKCRVHPTHWLISTQVDQPYSYHGDMVEARSSTASLAYREAGAPRSAASINHELSQAEHILHSLQKEPEALPRPGGPQPLDDAGSYTRPYKGPIVKDDWAGMTYGNTEAPPSQVGPRHPLSRMPPFAHGALDAKEQRTYFAPRPHLRKRAGYWPGLGTPHKTLS